MNIIAADVGGTKTRLIWVKTEQPQTIFNESKYNSNDYSDIEALLEVFISESADTGESADVFSLALPGAVEGDIVELTNLPWTVSAEALKQRFGVSEVLLMNDFQASSWGVQTLSTDELVQINSGELRDDGLRVTLGAGSGLGLSWMLDGSVYATEAGHIDFAPTSARQIALLEFLMQRHHHVSYERLLSGAGIVTLYEFCSGEVDDNKDAAWVTSHIDIEPAAREAVSLFVSIYGAYIGNIALLFRPYGGIYISGGIAPKIIQWMQSAEFLEAFYNKGRMRKLLEKIRVSIVTDERVGALGAMSIALKNYQD